MTSVDRLLLDWLGEKDIVFTPKVIYLNLTRELPAEELPSYSQIARRLRVLRDQAGLLEDFPETDESGQYQLSELGRRYLEDDLDDKERLDLATLEIESPDD